MHTSQGREKAVPSPSAWSHCSWGKTREGRSPGSGTSRSSPVWNSPSTDAAVFRHSLEICVVLGNGFVTPCLSGHAVYVVQMEQRPPHPTVEEARGHGLEFWCNESSKELLWGSPWENGPAAILRGPHTASPHTRTHRVASPQRLAGGTGPAAGPSNCFE